MLYRRRGLDRILVPGSGGGASNPFAPMLAAVEKYRNIGSPLVTLFMADGYRVQVGTGFCAALQNMADSGVVDVMIQPGPDGLTPGLGKRPAYSSIGACPALYYSHTDNMFLEAASYLDNITEGGTLPFTVFGFYQVPEGQIQSAMPIYTKAYAAQEWSLNFNGTSLAWGIGPVTLFGDAGIDDGLPHRVIGIYDPTRAPDPTILFYVDGVQQAMTSDSVDPIPDNGARMGIGAYVGAFGGTANAAPFEGLIGDVGSYSGGLTELQVAALDALMVERIGL